MSNIQGSINKLLGMLAGSELIRKQKTANDKSTSLQESKKTQKRNFMEYLKKQPVSLGKVGSGTVGDLPKEAQRQIASQYTRSQRKQMMDKMDMEAMKSGK